MPTHKDLCNFSEKKKKKKWCEPINVYHVCLAMLENADDEQMSDAGTDARQE